ncbi:hypothetical protein ACK3TF_000209 [Chlorella vulgaris]
MPPRVLAAAAGPATGWAISRGVLYFGVAAVVLVWACGFSIIFRRCMKRRRQERQTAADEGTPQQSTQQQGVQQLASSGEAPVVIVNPDNTSGLGIKEEACGRQSQDTAGPYAGTIKAHPDGRVAGPPALQPPPPPQDLAPWPPQAWLMQQQWVRQQPTQFSVEMGEARGWPDAGQQGAEPAAEAHVVATIISTPAPASSDGNGGPSSNTSSSGSSRGTGDATSGNGGPWGYRVPR